MVKLNNTNARKDWIEKLSTHLVQNHDIIALEYLKIQNMIKIGGGLARSMMQQGWGELRQRIEQKASTCGVHVVRVPPAFTSQRCNPCGHTAKENRENQADFLCVSCGHSANADVNAAKNILAAGLAATGRGGLGAVRPPTKRQLRKGIHALAA